MKKKSKNKKSRSSSFFKVFKSDFFSLSLHFFQRASSSSSQSLHAPSRPRETRPRRNNPLRDGGHHDANVSLESSPRTREEQSCCLLLFSLFLLSLVSRDCRRAIERKRERRERRTAFCLFLWLPFSLFLARTHSLSIFPLTRTAPKHRFRA